MKTRILILTFMFMLMIPEVAITSQLSDSDHNNEPSRSSMEPAILVGNGPEESATRSIGYRTFSYNWTMDDLVVNSTMVSGVYPTYFVEGSIMINSSTRLYVAPNSTIFVGDGVALDIKGALVADASDVDCICPIKFRPLNQSAGKGAWDSIVLNSTSSDEDTILSNVEISNATVGVRFIGSAPTVSQCTITNCGLRGIECSSNSAPLISQNILLNNAYGIFVDSGSSPTIISNDIETSPNVGILTHSSTATIAANILKDNFNGISIYSASPMIEGNTISGGGRGIFLYKSQSEIVGNHIDNSDITGVDIRANSNVLLSGNVITHSAGTGIKANASAIRVEECSVTHTSAGSEFGNGLTVEGCFSTEVINCTFKYNRGDGAELRDSDAVTLKGNTMEYNQKGGIDSFNCTLSLLSCVVSNNGKDVDWDFSGVYLWKSSLTGSDNTISGNGYVGFEAYHSDLFLSHCNMEGNYKGIELINCKLEIHDVDIWDTDEEGLLAQDGSEVSVEASSFAECGEDGIVILDGSTARVTDCDFWQCNWSALDVFGSSVDVSDCTIGDCGGSENYSGIYSGNSTLNVNACSITNNSGSGFLLSGTTATIVNTTIDPPTHHFINGWYGTDIILVNSIYNMSQVFLDNTSELAKMVYLWIEVLDMIGSPGQGALVTLETGPQRLSQITDVNGQAGPFFFEELSRVGDSIQGETISLIVGASGFAGYNTTIFSVTGPLVRVTVNRIPVVVIVTPAQGADVNGAVVVTGVASDPDGEIEGLSIMIGNGSSDSDGDGGWREIGAGSNWTYNWDTTRIVNGEAFIAVRAFDGSNYGVASITVNVDNEGGWDSDGDGLSDLREEQIGTDPGDPDTDGDGLKDGLEVDETDGFTTDPLVVDSDDDGLPDGQEDKNANGAVEGDDNRNGIWDAEEVWLETDPNNPDTDGDGIDDGEDPYPLDPDEGETDGDDKSFLDRYFVFILLPVVVIVLLVFMVIIKSRSTPGEKGIEERKGVQLKRRGKQGGGKGKKGN